MRSFAVVAFAFAGLQSICVYAGPLEIGFRLEWRKGQKSPVIVERIESTSAYGKLRDGEAVISIGGVAVRNQKVLDKLLEKKKAGESIDVVVQRGRKSESISIKIEDVETVQARHKRNVEAERRRWAGEGVPAIDSAAPPEVQRRQRAQLELKSLERQIEESNEPANPVE